MILAFFTESQSGCRRRLYEHQEHALYSPLFPVLINREPELKRCRTFLDGSSLEIQTLVVISYGRIRSNRQNLLTCTLCSSITYFQLMHMHSSRFLLHYDYAKALYHVRGKISRRRDQWSSWIFVSWDRDRSVHDRGHTVAHQHRCPLTSGRR